MIVPTQYLVLMYNHNGTKYQRSEDSKIAQHNLLLNMFIVVTFIQLPRAILYSALIALFTVYFQAPHVRHCYLSLILVFISILCRFLLPKL